MIITFEPVEVMSVHSDTYDETLVGAIEGRAVVTQQGQKLPTTYYPLDANMFQMPVRGEHVFGCVYAGKHYYFSKANFLNKVNNPRRGTSGYLTKGEDGSVTDRQSESRPYGAYFNSSLRAKKLWLNEGDTIIQGRFGNSIRLGSNQVNDQVGSTNIKITSGLTGFTNEGKLSIENIKSDLNSIHLTYNEKQNFDLPIESIRIQDVKDYDKAQVQIRSDRLIFTTKKSDGNSIGIFSGDKISIGSVNDVYVESPLVVMESSEVKVGSENAEEPQVLGQTLYDKLEALVTAIGGVTGIPTPTGPTPGPVSAAPNWSSVTSALSAVKDALSEKHRIDK